MVFTVVSDFLLLLFILNVLPVLFVIVVITGRVVRVWKDLR